MKKTCFLSIGLRWPTYINTMPLKYYHVVFGTAKCMQPLILLVQLPRLPLHQWWMFVQTHFLIVRYNFGVVCRLNGFQSLHPLLSHMTVCVAPAKLLFVPSSAAPAKILSGPCNFPCPSTPAAARGNGVATDLVQWAKLRDSRTSSTGAAGLSTELILECLPTLFWFLFVKYPTVLNFPFRGQCDRFRRQATLPTFPSAWGKETKY